jgi:hypothetical protein
MKYVYLLKSYESGYYKIGISKNPRARISSLQTGNPERIELVHSYQTKHYLKVETPLPSFSVWLSLFSIHNFHSFAFLTLLWGLQRERVVIVTLKEI